MNSTSSSKVLLITPVVLLLGLAVWSVARNAGGPSTATEPSSVAATGQAVSPAFPAGTDGAPGAPVRAISPDDPYSVLAPPRDPAAEAEKERQMVLEFERQHRSQSVDAAWKGRAEASLEEIPVDSGIQKSGIQPSSYKSDCRSQTCEISATFKNPGDADDWGMMFVTMSGGVFAQTKHMVIPKPDGTAELRIYGYRKR